MTQSYTRKDEHGPCAKGIENCHNCSIYDIYVSGFCYCCNATCDPTDTTLNFLSKSCIYMHLPGSSEPVNFFNGKKARLFRGLEYVIPDADLSENDQELLISKSKNDVIVDPASHAWAILQRKINEIFGEKCTLDNFQWSTANYLKNPMTTGEQSAKNSTPEDRKHVANNARGVELISMARRVYLKHYTDQPIFVLRDVKLMYTMRGHGILTYLNIFFTESEVAAMLGMPAFDWKIIDMTRMAGDTCRDNDTYIVKDDAGCGIYLLNSILERYMKKD